MTDLQKTAQKTFWKRPEGKTGMIVTAAAIAGGGYVAYEAMPYVVELLKDTLHACILGAGVLVVTAPVWSTRVRALCGYAFRSAMRKITALFVEIDPIGILKSYCEDLRKNQSRMDSQVANLNGHVRRLKEIIQHNEDDRAQSVKLAEQAQKKGVKTAFQLNARKAGRLKQSNVTLSGLLGKMEGLYRVLAKLRETADVTIQDLENEVEVREQERAAILAGYGAFTSAVKAMRGDPDKRALFDQAMEYLAEDYSKKVGEIEDFMRVSQGFIETVDLENAAFDEDALAELDKKLDARQEQLLLAPVAPSKHAELLKDLEGVSVPKMDETEIRSLYK